ncbi:hypothetical protein SDC9_33953 [bioreactor metagenome]|uniref:H/ACA RNA-protein complex component Gar1 n=1 Tax=bioreactor metagenome TaxID=1076179 RepID=A0A644V9C9_9ZZZZ|nr:Gar1/Naf1 family protein [uncultured Methanobrevibacter sp.]
MKFLGNISHISNSGRLIARSSQSPPSGASVFNKDKNKIGKIINVFGPTKEPYISVGIFKSFNLDEFRDSIGEDLYVSENPKNRKFSKNRHKKSNVKTKNRKNNKRSKNTNNKNKKRNKNTRRNN